MRASSRSSTSASGRRGGHGCTAVDHDERPPQREWMRTSSRSSTSGCGTLKHECERAPWGARAYGGQSRAGACVRRSSTSGGTAVEHKRTRASRCGRGALKHECERIWSACGRARVRGGRARAGARVRRSSTSGRRAVEHVNNSPELTFTGNPVHIHATLLQASGYLRRCGRIVRRVVVRHVTELFCKSVTKG